jgi:hypothetical protein
MPLENTNAATGDGGVMQKNVFRKERSSNSQLESRTQAPRKNERLLCPICEQPFKRQARQQRYCGSRCRQQAHYVKQAGLGDLPGQDTALPTNPHKSSREINALQVAKKRSSARIIGPRKVVAVEVFAGREWQEVVSSSGVFSYVSRLAKRALAEAAA